MRKIFLIFFAIFLTIYSSVHIYVLGRLFTWMGYPLDATYIATVVFLTLSFFFANALEQKYSHWFTNLIYFGTAVWMGIVAILLVAVLIGEIAIHFLPAQTVVVGIFIFTAVSTILGLAHARRPVLKKYTITGGANIRIGLLTDIHLGPVHGKKYAQKLVERLKKEDIDILLLGGDVIDGPGELVEDILTPFNAFTPTYMTWGNHEHYLGEKNVARVLKPTTIKPLRNKQITVKGVTLIGIDDAEDDKQLARMLPKFKAKGYTILLYHRPDGLEDAAKHGINLMLSGHTHNGQVFPFTLLVKARFSRINGWYTKGKTKLYVSTGAGTWGPPIRFGSRNECVVIDVKNPPHL